MQRVINIIILKLAVYERKLQNVVFWDMQKSQSSSLMMETAAFSEIYVCKLNSITLSLSYITCTHIRTCTHTHTQIMQHTWHDTYVHGVCTCMYVYIYMHQMIPNFEW